MSTERDTKFRGFALLLMQEITEQLSRRASLHPLFRDDVQTLIAQRAYDLALHILKCDALESINWISDLTEWPIPQTSVPQDHAPD